MADSAAGTVTSVSQVQLFAVKPCSLCYGQSLTEPAAFKAFSFHRCY